jgi:hypothetical protein
MRFIRPAPAQGSPSRNILALLAVTGRAWALRKIGNNFNDVTNVTRDWLESLARACARVCACIHAVTKLQTQNKSIKEYKYQRLAVVTESVTGTLPQSHQRLSCQNLLNIPVYWHEH